MIIGKEKFVVSKWMNGLGETLQLVISPEESDFKSQQFQYRISVASLTTDLSAFSKFEYYRRWLAIIEGGPVQINNKSKGHTDTLDRLKEVIEFDGGDELASTAESNGKDFNLFLRKGTSGNTTILTIKDKAILQINKSIHYFYNCDSQSLHFTSNCQAWTLQQGQLFEYRSNGQLTIQTSKGSSTILHCIIYN